MTTIKDVSRLAEVSVASVSKVMNGNFDGISESTRERILSAAKELQYRPNRIAQSLVKSKTGIIGLVVPDISNPYFAEFVKGAKMEAYAKNYNVILCDTDEEAEKERRNIEMLIGYNADGIIISGKKGQCKRTLKLLSDSNTPYITIDRESPYSMMSDTYMGSFLAVEYLHNMNHSKIAFIGGDEHGRYIGFINALKYFNLCIYNNLYKFGSYNMETGYKLGKELLKNKNFTAIFCGNDLIAFGALKAIRESGQNVPNDISLIGYDDIILSSFFEPKLTTIRQDTYNIGINAMQSLIQLIKNINIQLKHPEPKLMIRDSVKILC